jgi:shikimate kinase
MDVLKGTGLVILLDVPLNTLIQRVKLADRPRVNVGTTLEEDVRKIWDEAQEKYYRAADIVYRTEENAVDEEVAELKRLILARPGSILPGASHGK